MEGRKVIRLVSAGQVDQAERVAIKGLTWISNDIDRVCAFIDRTGIRADQMRAIATSRAFLLGVVEHIMSDDEWLVHPFCASMQVTAAELCEARDVLASPHRTKYQGSETLIPKILPRRGFV